MLPELPGRPHGAIVKAFQGGRWSLDINDNGAVVALIGTNGTGHEKKSHRRIPIQRPSLPFSVKTSLQTPQSIINDDAHGIGQIEAADVLAEDRNPVQTVGMLSQQIFGQPHRFFSKDEEHIIPVINGVMRLRPLAREERKVGVLVDGHEVFQTLVDANIQVLPIVQTGALEAGVCNLESKGLNQVKGRPRSQTQSPNVACVGRDFRLHEYNIESHLVV